MGYEGSRHKFQRSWIKKVSACPKCKEMHEHFIAGNKGVKEPLCCYCQSKEINRKAKIARDKKRKNAIFTCKKS